MKLKQNTFKTVVHETVWIQTVLIQFISMCGRFNKTTTTTTAILAIVAAVIKTRQESDADM